MIQDSKILQWFKLQENKKTWLVILFTRPKLYLYNLLKRTIFIGIFLLFLYESFKYFQIVQTQLIPSMLHSLLGLVIGLLLVFRTNTAYDRWWEARKVFSLLHSALIYLRVNLSNAGNRELVIQQLLEFNENIFKYVSAEEGIESVEIKDRVIANYNNLSAFAANSTGGVERKMIDVLDYFTSLERIKDTPIPMSYSFHIKLSLFIYLLSLPFGMLFELKMWSIPCVMILFFVIAGIEIISNEIENPFKGDPNDLPIDDYKKENEKYIS